MNQASYFPPPMIAKRNSDSPKKWLAVIQIAKAFREGHIDAFRFHINVNAKFSGERHQNLALARIDRKQRRTAWKFNIAHGTKC